MKEPYRLGDSEEKLRRIRLQRRMQSIGRWPKGRLRQQRVLRFAALESVDWKSVMNLVSPTR